MGWSSIIKSKPAVAERASAPLSPESVQQARARARRRLIGAFVLVVIGVIGFPLLFETQPRPVPVDIPIEIPRKDNAVPLAMPSSRAASRPAVVAAVPASSALPASAPKVITETREEAGREVAASAPAKPPPVAVANKPAEPKPAAAPKQTPTADASRAEAVLEGKPAIGEGAARFVVQAGAFADATAAQGTRQKLERLGLKTYTQVAETSAGKRVRVRLGPYASRDEAEKALAKARAAGLAAVMITL